MLIGTCTCASSSTRAGQVDDGPIRSPRLPCPSSCGSGNGCTRALRYGSRLLRFQERDALDALHDQLDDALAARHLLDDGARADGIQVARVRAARWRRRAGRRRRTIFSSVASTASMAASELGRPTASGMNRCGNRTVFFSGRTGRTTTLSVGVTRRLHRGCERATCHRGSRW